MNHYYKWLLVFSVVLISACGAQEVELNVTLYGEGRITSPAGVDCSEDCVAKVQLSPPFIGNKRVRLTANPAPGYEFLGWNHHSCTSEEICDLEFTGICFDQLLCSTGIVYSEQAIKPVFVDSALLLASDWSERSICAVFSSGEVQCWAHFYQSEVENVPQLNNPQNVAVGGSVACAQVDEGISCWGHPNLLPKGAPLVYPPLEMKMLSSQICVLDQEGVKCWSSIGLRDTPEFTNPMNLRTKAINTPDFSGYQFCVDDEGVEVCW